MLAAKTCVARDWLVSYLLKCHLAQTKVPNQGSGGEPPYNAATMATSGPGWSGVGFVHQVGQIQAATNGALIGARSWATAVNPKKKKQKEKWWSAIRFSLLFSLSGFSRGQCAPACPSGRQSRKETTYSRMDADHGCCQQRESTSGASDASAGDAFSSTATPPRKRRCVLAADDPAGSDYGVCPNRTETSADTGEERADATTTPSLWESIDDAVGGNGSNWRHHTVASDWTKRRMIHHYDDDLNRTFLDVDVTAEYALWKAYERSGERILTTDPEVLHDALVEFAGDFLDESVYDDMLALEQGKERRLWICEQPPAVRNDRARRSRLYTVIGDVIERDDRDIGSDDELVSLDGEEEEEEGNDSQVDDVDASRAANGEDGNGADKDALDAEQHEYDALVDMITGKSVSPMDSVSEDEDAVWDAGHGASTRRGRRRRRTLLGQLDDVDLKHIREGVEAAHLEDEQLALYEDDGDEQSVPARIDAKRTAIQDEEEEEWPRYGMDADDDSDDVGDGGRNGSRADDWDDENGSSDEDDIKNDPVLGATHHVDTRDWPLFGTVA